MLNLLIWNILVCLYLVHLVVLFSFISPYIVLSRLKSDLKTPRDMDIIGIGFQHVVDSYFWYLPCASVRQCKYVMDKAGITLNEWTTKRGDLADEHKLPGVHESLRTGFKEWITSNLFKKSQASVVSVPKSTKPIIVDED
jgi:hypothetical protein